MPLAYESGTLAEHMACRTAAVAFDVSHLGTVRVEGQGAFDALQGALSNDLRKVAPGRAQYTHLLDDADGSVLDDIIVWWLAPTVFDVMPNASNTSRGARCAGGHRHHRRARRRSPCRAPRRVGAWRRSPPEAAAVGRFAVAGVLVGRHRLHGGGHGLHGRGRGRVRRAPRRGAVVLAGRARGGCGARRPRRARHPPPRGRPAPARPRARAGHHPAPSGAGLGGRVGQRGLPGSTGARGGTRRRSAARLVGLRHRWAPDHRATRPPCCETTWRWER